jgi:hypothetical protein
LIGQFRYIGCIGFGAQVQHGAQFFIGLHF